MADSIHGDQTAYSIHGDQTAESIHGDQTAESIHRNEAPNCIHGDQTAYSIHGDQTAESIHGDQTAESIHSPCGTVLGVRVESSLVQFQLASSLPSAALTPHPHTMFCFVLVKQPRKQDNCDA
eukprot:scaffold7084_cov97-Isochrysis_galbana.AAC.1